MRIGYFLPNYKAYSEIWLERQIAYLKEEIVFLATNNPSEKRWNNEIPIIDLSPKPTFSKRIGYKIFRNRPSQYSLIRKSIHYYKPDKIIIHYLTFAYQLREVISFFSGEIYIYCHGNDVTWDMKYNHYPNANKYQSEYLQFPQNIQDKVIFIANSEETKKRLLIAGVRKSNIRRLYLGYPIQPSTYHQPERKLKILYLGRLIDCKGPDLTIQAFEKACEMGFQGELIIAGAGPLMMTCQILQRRSKFADRIKILGAVPFKEAKLLLQECDIFTAHNQKGVITNQIEAYGVSIIEAMAHGLPVVTGKSGGVQETIKDGETGFLITPGDIHAHAEKLLLLEENQALRYRLGQKGKERVNLHFSHKKEKESLLKILAG